jgi:uncharacterized protein (DUF433 family)
MRNLEGSRMKIVESARTARGLYTLLEAATYARIHPQTLGNWIYGTLSCDPLRPAMIPKDEGGKFLTFVEFVEALAIRNLRRTYNVPFQRIREAINEARTKYGVEYPFARQDHKIFRVGKDLHIVLSGEEHPVGLSGKDRAQESLRPCLEPFMRDVEWNPQKMASAYIAYRYPVQDKNIIIRMRPDMCFGSPLVEGTGHTAETLWRAALAEGSYQKAAEYYEVDCDSVVAACRYCDELQLAA